MARKTFRRRSQLDRWVSPSINLGVDGCPRPVRGSMLWNPLEIVTIVLPDAEIRVILARAVRPAWWNLILGHHQDLKRMKS